MSRLKQIEVCGQACRRGIGRLATCLPMLALLASAGSSSAQITVEPDDQTILMFAGPQGGPFTPAALTTWKVENTAAQEISYVAVSDQPWLTVSPSEGDLGGILNNTVDIEAQLDIPEAQNLAPGVYTATVSFRNLTDGAGNTTRTVRLEVAPASFVVTPAFVTATVNLNGGNPLDKTVTLTNSGLVDLNYSLTWQAQAWLQLSRDGGTVPGAGSSTFIISFNTAGLTAGTYTAEIEIENTTNGAGSRKLPVTLTVKSTGASSVSLKPDTDIEVIGPVGTLATPLQQSTIVNDSDKSVRWNAIVSGPWISVNPSAGELAPSDGFPGGLDERSVSIRVNAAVQTLPPGAVAGTATFQTITTNLITGEITGVAFGTRVVHIVANPVLTLTVPALGGGVATSPEGDSLGATATTQRMTFPFGQVVVVTATPVDGYEFRGWAGDFPEDAQLVNPLILPMDASKSLGALIAPILRTLSLSTTGAGTGTIDPDPTGAEVESALEARYTNGTSVKLFAEADDGSVFVGWDGNVPQGQEKTNPLTVLMDRERVISARFEPAVAFSVSLVGNGDVRIEPDLPAYGAGMTVTLTALADDGFRFSGWGGAASGTTSTLTFTLSADTIITATFTEGEDPGEDPGEEPGNENVAKLFVDIQGDGLVTPDGGNYVKGATVTVIATPTITSKFVRWEQDAVGTELTTSVLMDADKTVRAVFETIQEEDPASRPPPSGSGGSTCGAAGMIGLAGMFLGWFSLTLVSRRTI